MGEVASHDIVYNTTMVWNEFRAIADLLRANVGKVADQGIALSAITRATQVSKYVVQSVQTSAKTGIPYLRDYSQELQVNALDVLRSVKDLFKEGAFLGEPAVKSMESMLMDKIYPVVTKLIAAAKSIQQQAAPQSAPSAGAPATPNLRSAYYSSGYNAVSNTGSTSSPPNSARSPPSALAPPPALSAPPALSPPPMLSSPPMSGGGAAPPPLPQRDDTYHNLRTSASHTRTQPPQQLPPNSLGSSSSGSRSRYNPSGMAPPPALAPPPTLSPPPTLALPPSLHSPPIASPSAAHRPYSSAYNVAPVPSPNSGGGSGSGLGSSNSYTRGQPSPKGNLGSNSSSNIPSLSSGGSYSRTSPPNSSYSSNYPAVSSSGGGYYPRPPLSNGSPSLPPPPALPTDLPPLPPNGLPPPPLPPGNLPPMPTDLPPLPPPGALPPMPTDLPPLPPPTEHLPIPPAMLGDEIRNQARSVVQQVMQLNQIIHEQNEEAFVEEARRTLNQLNALIARAKDFSLVQEENELRDATYEFISAAKERIGGGSSEQEFDQAVAFLADTIRLFVEAVAVAILPPPPPPREDFAKEAEDTGAEGEAKRKRLRSNVLKELLNTETTYFTQLKTLDFSFIQLIKNRKDLKLRPVQTMNDPIFTSFVLCVPPIVSLSKELVGELTSRINKMSDSDQVHVGDTFVRLAPVFKMYQTYINNYDQAMAKLRQGIETEPEFDALVKQFCPPGSPDISFFFILPIQRLPRYELLLREVLKFTDKANSADEYSNLGAAILKVKESNDSINEKKRQDENMKKMIDIQNSITNEKLALLKPGRNYIREGSMEEPDASGKKARGKGKSFHYFMFTDVLLKTRFERKAKNYTLVDTIWFAEVSLRDVNLSAKDLLNLFELVGSSDKFTFNCITEDEKRSWMKDMQEAIEKARAGDGSPGGRTMRTLRRGTNGEDYEGGSPRLGKKSDKKEKKSKSKRERSGTGSKLLSSLKKGD